MILEDLRLLNVTWDIFSHTSDYFDSMLQYCEQLLKSGDAYVDDTEAETMKLEREQKVESKNRNNSKRICSSNTLFIYLYLFLFVCD